jgi:hypothetical protein
MASLAELETGCRLYRERRVEILEGEETRSELPHIFGRPPAACSTLLGEWWLPQPYNSSNGLHVWRVLRDTKY